MVGFSSLLRRGEEGGREKPAFVGEKRKGKKKRRGERKLFTRLTKQN